MPLHIDRVDTEIEILRKEDTSATSTGGGPDSLSSIRGRSELREKLRPIVMEILNDELNRIKRKVGSP